MRKLNLADGPPQHRFVFFTDLHHKGDRRRLDALVQKINALSPEGVIRCWTNQPPVRRLGL